MKVGRITVKPMTPTKEHVKAKVPKKARKASISRDRVEIGKKKKKKQSILTSAKKWIKTNIIGTTAKTKGKKGKKIDMDYGDRRIALFAGVGAGAGAAVGTAVGMAAGYHEMANDKIEKVMIQYDITHPRLVGYHHHVYEDGHYETRIVGYDSDGNPITESFWVIDGYEHRFYPDIERKIVGHYKTPEFKHSSWFNPFTGGLVGLATGAAIGAGLGVVIGVIDKALRNS